MTRVLTFVLVIHGLVVAQDRALDWFAARSRANLSTRSVAELSGYDPFRDKDFHLWVQRAAADGFRSPGTGPLFLHGVSELSLVEATRLAQWQGRVFLPDLVSLDVERARALASGRLSELHLDGLRALELPVARVLANWGGRILSLGGVATMSTELATVLASFRGSLALDGITHLDEAAATALARWAGYGEKVFLSLDQLSVMSHEVLERLAACQGWGLSIGGIRRLEPAQAALLAKVPCAFLRLDGVIELPLETARVMAGWERKFLSLDGLARLDDELAALVRQGCEALSLDGLGPDVRPRYRLAPLPVARYEQLALGHGFSVFVVGGRRPGRGVDGNVPALDIYDVSRNQWRQGAPMPVGRYFLSGAILDGCIYVCGGEGKHPATVHRYHIVDDRWDTVASQPTPRTHATAVAARGRLWVIGGYRRQAGGNLDSVEVYDPKLDAWAPGPALPRPVHGHAVATVGDAIHVVGGDESPRRHLVLEGERWADRAPVPDDLIFAEAVSISGRLWVIGGAPDFRGLRIYDPSTDRWERGADAPNPRYHFAATAVDGSLYALGGLPVAGSTAESARALDRFDPRSGAWYR